MEPGRKILILRTAVGGTGFRDHRWGMTDDLYLQMMEMIRTALSLNPKNRNVRTNYGCKRSNRTTLTKTQKRSDVFDAASFSFFG